MKSLEWALRQNEEDISTDTGKLVSTEGKLYKENGRRKPSTNPRKKSQNIYTINILILKF